MDAERKGADRARLWRGLAVWPLVVGAGAATVVFVVRPEDVGPGLTVVAVVAVSIGFIAVVVGCVGVARTSVSVLERRVFTVLSVVLVAGLSLAVLTVIGLAVAMCGSSPSGC